MVGFFFQDLVSVDVEISQWNDLIHLRIVIGTIRINTFIHNPIFCTFFA